MIFDHLRCMPLNQHSYSIGEVICYRCGLTPVDFVHFHVSLIQKGIATALNTRTKYIPITNSFFVYIKLSQISFTMFIFYVDFVFFALIFVSRCPLNFSNGNKWKQIKSNSLALNLSERVIKMQYFMALILKSNHPGHERVSFVENKVFKHIVCKSISQGHLYCLVECVVSWHWAILFLDYTKDAFINHSKMMVSKPQVWTIFVT